MSDFLDALRASSGNKVAPAWRCPSCGKARRGPVCEDCRVKRPKED